MSPSPVERDRNQRCAVLWADQISRQLMAAKPCRDAHSRTMLGVAMRAVAKGPSVRGNTKCRNAELHEGFGSPVLHEVGHRHIDGLRILKRGEVWEKGVALQKMKRRILGKVNAFAKVSEPALQKR